ncbi:hypothetical protein ACLKA6_002446 [Drosophila palustris]
MMMRFGDIEKNFIYAESTILDPRFKSRGFKNEDNFKDAVQNLKIKLQSVIVADPEDAEEMDMPHGPVDKPSFWDAYDSEFRSVSHPANKTVASQREMDKYLGEEYLDRKGDPLKWWNARRKQYPRLFIYMQRRLCIVATSTLKGDTMLGSLDKSAQCYS